LKDSVVDRRDRINPASPHLAAPFRRTNDAFTGNYTDRFLIDRYQLTQKAFMRRKGIAW